jgi:Uma2 family endonuclease
MSVQIARRYFNVTEYYRMGEAGILSEDDRVELIEGEILEMSPIGSRHAACVKRLNTLLGRQVSQNITVSVQDPIRLDDYSEPQPDVALLRAREDFYAEGHPTPSDVLIVIEVADTSVEYDRDMKVPLYARAAVPEVWLVDLPEDSIEIYTEPQNGAYREFRKARRGETVGSRTIPDLTLSVDAILG